MILEHEASPLGQVELSDRACTVCGTCVVACPSGALQQEERSGSVAITFDPNLCSGCGRCVDTCPERASGAIRGSHTVDITALRSGRRQIAEASAGTCSNCGAGLGSARVLDRIRALLGDSSVDSPVNALCGSCRAATALRVTSTS
jgi:ferredoxin